MEDKERYTYEVLKDMYERSLNDGNDIVSRTQNPLTAVSVIIAILVYIAPKVYEFPKLSLENTFILGSFYVTLVATLICTGLTIYYLVRAFKLGGHEYKTIGSPQQIISLFEIEENQVSCLIELYKMATENNLENNRIRQEYIRKATETIIMAVTFCFPCGFLYCIITSIIGLNR